jgi:hypothetical protein
LEKDEDRNARQAVESLNGTRILWKTGCTGSTAGRSGSGNGSGAGGFLSSLFGGGGTSLSGGSSSTAAVEAALMIRDDAHGEPEFYVIPKALEDSCNADPGNACVDDYEEEVEDGRSRGGIKDSSSAAVSSPSPSSSSSTGAVGYKLHVRIRRIDRVTLDENDVVLLARKVDPSQPAPKQLLRFCLLSDSLGGGGGATTERRNLIVHHLAVLVEWERQRRLAAGYHPADDDLEDEDDNDSDQPNFLAARAQKAAHFARRELEMRETRREREKRKAKLVQETGGLKYTALVMASRGGECA